MPGFDHSYRRRVDPSGDDSLAAIVRCVRPHSRVLELGVATGYLSRYLSEEHGCLVDGVEIDPAMAREAAPWCNRLLEGDLQREPLGRHFPNGYYDYVIAADVLEHLVEPGAVLRQIPALLRPNGRLIVSLPNTAYAGLILELISGELRYRPEGLLDRTHLRFFTANSARRMLEEQGFLINAVTPVRFPFELSEFRDLFARMDPELVARISAIEHADVYQFVLSAHPAMQPQAEPVRPVDLVVPVHRGLEATRRCLESVLGSPQAVPFELVVVDDASPEPELVAYLDRLAADGRITLLRNTENQGFVVSVNRGMALHPDRDVVLLNSDTDVHGDWLTRMAACANGAEDIASVTPFTNNGTLCSYPRIFADNPLPEGWNTADLDALFREQNRGCSVAIPTAVGFCMYLRRSCLDRVGLFDAEAFGLGYGEEVDFCMRAAKAGFRHLLCADTFVYHQGGGSFGCQASELQARAQEIVNRRYPQYVDSVRRHLDSDPARSLRRRIDFARLRLSAKPLVLFVLHYGGGGTEQHLMHLSKLVADQADILLLRPLRLGRVRVESTQTTEELAVYFSVPDEYEALTGFLRTLGVVRVHYHHLMGHDPAILNLAADLAVPYDFTLHDFYPVCPLYQMVDVEGRYCGQPNESGCNRCLHERPPEWGLDIAAWRSLFRKLLASADRVIAPSKDAAARLNAYLDLPNILVRPHPERVRMPQHARIEREREGPVKVLVLGRMTPEKGLRLLKRCAADAKARDLPLLFRVVGYCTEACAQWPELPLTVSGEYSPEDLDRLIEFERGDLVFFPALWPETYSYTLTAAINSELPIAAPDLGAFPERLADHPAALLEPWDTQPAAWNDALLSFRARLLSTQGGD